MASVKWTHNPPCEAELFLENLIIKEKINPSDSSSKVQKKYPIFRQFSQAVFRNNFKRLCDRYGVGLCKYITEIKNVTTFLN